MLFCPVPVILRLLEHPLTFSDDLLQVTEPGQELPKLSLLVPPKLLLPVEGLLRPVGLLLELVPEVLIISLDLLGLLFRVRHSLSELLVFMRCIGKIAISAGQ